MKDQYTEYYYYTAPGAVAEKMLALVRQFPDGSYGAASAEAMYTYDTAGRQATVTYPMTFTDNQGNWPVLATAYDTMGRPASLTDQVDNTHWVSSAQYDFAGRMTSLSYLTGNGSGSPSAASETRTYNAATGQLASLSWSAAGVSGGIQYAYSATQNNGQITQATDTVSGETIVYQYDALKRLTSAGSTPINGSTPTAWTQTFQYDGFGNLTAKVLNGTTNSIPVNAPTNQLTNANYDANGNMTSGVGATLTYDEANRMITAQEVSGGKEYYGYDAANKRVYRVTSSRQEQITFYGAFGEKLGVYGIQAGTCNYYYINPSPCVSGFTPLSTSIWFGGRLIMDSGNGVVEDRLGTNRVSGARFYPYGDEITSTTNDREKFATYTRDSYTGLDYADQRFYASTYGRFNTADPYQATAKGANNTSDPVSWNRYTYTGGDPINRSDPGGTCWIDNGLVVDPAGCTDEDFWQSTDWACLYLGTCYDDNPTPPTVTETSAPPPICGSVVGIPSSAYEGDEIAVLFGEDSWTLGYPTAQVTQEDRWMLNGMANQAIAYNQQPNQAGVEVSIQKGAYLGYSSGLGRLDSAETSSVGSSACQHLQEAESTFTSFWSAGGIFAPGYSRWVATASRTQPAPTDVTIAGTTFFLGTSSPPRRSPLPSPPVIRPR